MGTIMDKLPTPIPLSSRLVHTRMLPDVVHFLPNIRDESASKNGIRTSINGTSLNNNTNDKDAAGNNDSVFARDRLGHEARKQSSKPGTELENGRQPTLLGLAGVGVERIVFSHV